MDCISQYSLLIYSSGLNRCIILVPYNMIVQYGLQDIQTHDSALLLQIGKLLYCHDQTIAFVVNLYGIHKK